MRVKSWSAGFYWLMWAWWSWQLSTGGGGWWWWRGGGSSTGGLDELDFCRRSDDWRDHTGTTGRRNHPSLLIFWCQGDPTKKCRAINQERIFFRLKVLLLRKVKDRACTAVFSPNYLYWSVLQAPPASLEARLCSLKRPWAGGQSA